MSTDEYVPSDQDMAHWFEGAENPEYGRALWDRWLAAHDARVRRDAALTLAEHFSAEAIDQAHRGNPDGADFYHAVATEIENQIPEETP